MRYGQQDNYVRNRVWELIEPQLIRDVSRGPDAPAAFVWGSVSKTVSEQTVIYFVERDEEVYLMLNHLLHTMFKMSFIN